MDMTYGASPGSKGARWVCPNDRQLALRAKLRTGWSVKSSSFDSRFTDYTYSSSCPGNLNSSTSSSSSTTPFALSDAERMAIIQVIQRAEALDVSEQERVGRLVERLENMKRNVYTVTTTRSNARSCGSRCSGGNGCICSCALCGEKFAVLGAGPSLCRDCRKYICQKCGIETSPSYLLTPGSSGASSAGSGATTPQQQQQQQQQQQPHQNVAQQLRIKSPSGCNKLFLCRICAETREMWKKSGAWFFKGLPKYVLPEKKERGRSRTGSRASGWMLTGGTKSLEPPEQDSSSDDEATRRMTRTRSLLSASCESDVIPSEGATTPVSQGGEMRPPQLRLRSNSSTSEERRPSSENPAEVADNSSHSRRVSSSASTITIRSKTGGNANGQRSGRRSTTDDDKKSELLASEHTSVSQVHLPSASNVTISSSSSSRRESNATGSVASSITSESSFALVDHHLHHHHLHERSRHSRDLEIGNHNHLEHLPRIENTGSSETGQGYGTLEISLRYEPAGQCLQCKVLRARGLRPMDIHGLADPFCKLNILPITSSTTIKRLKTKTVHKTRDPEFNEQLNFYGITESDMKSGRALHVLILQDDRVARDFLGEAKFPLYEVPPYQTRYYNVFLEDHYQVSQEERVWGEDTTNGRGQIQLTLSYSTRRRALLVTVERATNLLPMDSNGFSDPFVKLCLTKEQPKDGSSAANQQRHGSFGQATAGNIGVKKAGKKLASSPRSNTSNAHSTSVKWKTLNPEWNEEFAFETPLTDLTGLALVMSVWDKDLGKSNDYLGGLTLSCSSKGARLRHWIDVIKFPDHHHQASHNLIEDLITVD